MSTNPTRRRFILGGTLATAGLLAGKNEPALADEKHAEHDQDGHANTLGGPQDRGKLVVGRRKPGDPPVPIQTPDLPKLEPTIKDGVKEFQLICQHTKREFLPGQIFDVWGYNDSMPGPTIEVVEGDKVRILVHNMLPEATTLHLHGLELPIAMDGVPGLTQDPIPPHGNFVYEFQVHQNGTFFYHSHGAMQEGMGMVGLFIIHPKTAWTPPVDRDFGLIIQEWAILPGATVPNTMSMEFNYFTINGRSAPYITPLVVRQGDRVRIRLVNFSSINHHPIHMHGMTFWVTGTEGGRIPESAWVPGNNVLLGVAQARDIEFVASYPGDWMMHCHMFHHMMNHMTSMVGMMGSLSQSDSADASTLFNVIQRLGGSFGIGLLASIFAARANFHDVVWALVAVSAFGIVPALLLGARPLKAPAAGSPAATIRASGANAVSQTATPQRR